MGVDRNYLTLVNYYILRFFAGPGAVFRVPAVPADVAEALLPWRD